MVSARRFTFSIALTGGRPGHVLPQPFSWSSNGWRLIRYTDALVVFATAQFVFKMSRIDRRSTAL